MVVVPKRRSYLIARAQPSGLESQIAHRPGEHHARSRAGGDLGLVVRSVGQGDLQVARIGVVMMVVVIDGRGFAMGPAGVVIMVLDILECVAGHPIGILHVGLNAVFFFDMGLDTLEETAVTFFVGQIEEIRIVLQIVCSRQGVDVSVHAMRINIFPIRPHPEIEFIFRFVGSGRRIGILHEGHVLPAGRVTRGIINKRLDRRIRHARDVLDLLRFGPRPLVGHVFVRVWPGIIVIHRSRIRAILLRPGLNRHG